MGVWRRRGISTPKKYEVETKTCWYFRGESACVRLRSVRPPRLPLGSVSALRSRSDRLSTVHPPPHVVVASPITASPPPLSLCTPPPRSVHLSPHTTIPHRAALRRDALGPLLGAIIDPHSSTSMKPYPSTSASASPRRRDDDSNLRSSLLPPPPSKRISTDIDVVSAPTGLPSTPPPLHRIGNVSHPLGSMLSTASESSPIRFDRRRRPPPN
jgi:hypothetical protein